MKSTFARSIVLVALLARTPAAWAASCCGSNAAVGNRLAAFESAAWSMGLSSVRDRYGSELRMLLSGSLRLNDDWQAGLFVPWVAGFRPGETGHGIGDVTLDARRSFGGSSTWAVLAQLAVPTGTSYAESRTARGADVTGQGRFEGRGTVWREWFPEPWFVNLAVTAVAAGPDRSGLFLGECGGDLLAVLGWSGPRSAVSLALLEAARWTWPVSGAPGHRRRATATLTTVIPVSSRIDALASAGLSPEIVVLSARETAQWSATAALRMAWP